MAKRPPFSRWRRLPPVFRSGEHKLPGYEDEPQRIIVYLPGALLDRAEELAEKAGVPTIQEYCATLLSRAIENERVRNHLADVEARRGPLEGLQQIAGDPEYLVEWQKQADSRSPQLAGPSRTEEPRENPPDLIIPVDALAAFELESHGNLERDDGQTDEVSGEVSLPAPATNASSTRLEPFRPGMAERIIPEVMDTTKIEILLSHVGSGDADRSGFLHCLRRGTAVPAEKVSELLRTLTEIERENAGSELFERRLAYALYRLALESQVLLTDVWPGVFDEPTVGAIRAVQERVERILSGQDIRF